MIKVNVWSCFPQNEVSELSRLRNLHWTQNLSMYNYFVLLNIFCTKLKDRLFYAIRSATEPILMTIKGRKV